jgi:hypothetical protein
LTKRQLRRARKKIVAAKSYGKKRDVIFLATVTAKITGRQNLHRTNRRLRSMAVIKRIAIPAVSFLAIAFLISACVSRDEDISERSSSQSAATVPGEKIPDEGAYAPGPPGSSGSIRW